MPYEDRREQDRDTIERWAEAEGVDLEGEAEAGASSGTWTERESRPPNAGAAVGRSSLGGRGI